MPEIIVTRYDGKGRRTGRSMYHRSAWLSGEAKMYQYPDDPRTDEGCVTYMQITIVGGPTFTWRYDDWSRIFEALQDYTEDARVWLFLYTGLITSDKLRKVAATLNIRECPVPAHA